MSDMILETYARMAANQMVTTYVPQARDFGLNKQQIIWLIKRVAELAVEKIG